MPVIQLYCLLTAISINHTNAPNGHGPQLIAHLMSAMKLYSVKDCNKMLQQLVDKALMIMGGARDLSPNTRGLQARSANLVKNVITWVI